MSSVVVLALHAAYYYPFVPDDAFISFRYAKRLAQGMGLTWTSGPPVEGYSNFLWTLVLAGAARWGADVIVAARALGAVSSVCVVLALCVAAVRSGTWSAPAAALACALWVMSASVGAWTLAGLEHPLVAALLAWSIVWLFRLQARGVSSARDLWAPGLVLGVLCLVRLDTPLLVFVVAVWWWWAGGCNRRAATQCAALLAIPLLVLFGQEIFRIVYYDDWLPNVARAKLTTSSSRFASGVQYVLGGFSSMRPWGEVAIVTMMALLVHRPTRVRAVLLVALTFTWLAYIAIVGRDLFPAWRRLLPVVLCVAMTLALGFDAAAATGWMRRRRRLVGMALTVGFAFSAWNQFGITENQRAKLERWEWNGEVIGRALKDGFGQQEPVLAIMAAGAVPYWAEIDCLDMFGLSDRHIARVRSEEWGQGKLGHETRDADYVLSRNPDLMLFGTPGGYEPSAYVEGMENMPAFRNRFQRCNISGDVPYFFNSRMWVNRESERIGIRRTDKTLVVPAYLLNLTGGAIARLDENKLWYVGSTPDAPVGASRLQLARGRWVVHEPAGDVRVLVNNPARGFREAVLDSGVRTFRVDDPGRFDILVVPRADTLRVHRLRLEHLRVVD